MKWKLHEGTYWEWFQFYEGIQVEQKKNDILVEGYRKILKGAVLQTTQGKLLRGKCKGYKCCLPGQIWNKKICRCQLESWSEICSI